MQFDYIIILLIHAVDYTCYFNYKIPLVIYNNILLIHSYRLKTIFISRDIKKKFWNIILGAVFIIYEYLFQLGRSNVVYEITNFGNICSAILNIVLSIFIFYIILRESSLKKSVWLIHWKIIVEMARDWKFLEF